MALAYGQNRIKQCPGTSRFKSFCHCPSSTGVGGTLCLLHSDSHLCLILADARPGSSICQARVFRHPRGLGGPGGSASASRPPRHGTRGKQKRPGGAPYCTIGAFRFVAETPNIDRRRRYQVQSTGSKVSVGMRRLKAPGQEE